MSLPNGTVTFLFTDIEGSTGLWESHPEAMSIALARHDQLMKDAIELHHGQVFKTIGDAFCAAFESASDALNAAVAAQSSLILEVWPDTTPVKVRIAIHSGLAESRDNDYFGQPVNRVARLLSTAHGGQSLLSQTAYDMVRENLPAGVTFRDLGAHQLKDLARQEQVYQLQRRDLPDTFPHIKSLSTHPTNLPQQLTSFIGRDKELADIKEMLQNTRLLTLTGSGGTGKTRLMLQAAADVLEQYADGIWLVELASLSDPALVPQAVAQALSIREIPGESLTQTLINSLKTKEMLLALDNCEHLLHASALIVDGLLKSGSRVRVLASSREALGIGGESAYRVPSLSLPDAAAGLTPASLSRFGATRLFIDRALAARADFIVTKDNASALASVCRRLDGIPLAIELAAARVRALPVEEINNRLDQRFRLLMGGSRTSLPRQQTLRALIDWSYDLLNTQEKALLSRLSVFSGGWTLSDAESVCSDSDSPSTGFTTFAAPVAESEETSFASPGGNLSGLCKDEVVDLLASLVDKSLVAYEESANMRRYRLLETVRQYAFDRLEEFGDDEVMQQRHLACFLLRAEEAEPNFTGLESAKWYRNLDREHENLRSALTFSLKTTERASDTRSNPNPVLSELEAVRLCGALWRFWSSRGYLSEGREWCAKALDNSLGNMRTKERAKLLNGAGGLSNDQCDYASARTFYEESVAIRREIGDLQGVGASLHNLGNVAFFQGDYTSARTYVEESLAICRETKDRSGLASSLGNLGGVAYYQGDLSAARAYFEESLALSRETGNRGGIAGALSNLGSVSSDQGDYISARTYIEESLSISREIGNRASIAGSLHYLGIVSCRLGDHRSGITCFEESMAIFREIGHQRGVAELLATLASLAATQGHLVSAAMLWGSAESLRQEIGSPVPPNDKEQYDRDVAKAMQNLSAAEFSKAWEKGRGMLLDQAIEMGLSA